MLDPADFVRVGLVPDLVGVWVLAELAVFESLPGGFVEDRKVQFLQKGRGICASAGGVG